ncbi:MAG: cytochrome c oxidase accessory protein CcoG [Proteobacteria bacterium]|nr:cytochrome c oxidase accessory protein CcoG [Pseudomonadota bacterium]
MNHAAPTARPVIPIAPVPPSDDAAVQVVSMYQAEAKIHPRSVQGWFAAWRWLFVWGTQLLYYGLPWLTWNDRQAVLFDLGARRFYIFGLVLYPQDFIYLTGLLVVSAYALFLFTAVAGRLWCGFACPQTVYTEIYLWVERRFEGDRAARMKLDAGPWTLEKWLRKGGKQVTWVAIGLVTGITFVGYFTPIRTLLAETRALDLGAWEAFWILFYGFATYGNAGYMREQVCKYMCPYARFQSAMFDHDTMIVSYDAQRGDPRGSRPRSLPHAELASRGKGECIDCTLCVQVCPTGIDIREGLQYECISCAACIDVCNGVMDKMAYPRGLIRFATQNGLKERWTRRQMFGRVLRPRVLVYSSLLLAIVAGLAISLALRSPFRVDVVRDRGALAREVQDGRIENVYRLQVMNSAESAERFRIGVADLSGAVVAAGAEVEVGPTEARWVPVAVQLPAEAAHALGPGAHRMRFVIERLADRAGTSSVVEKSTFVVPR